MKVLFRHLGVFNGKYRRKGPFLLNHLGDIFSHQAACAMKGTAVMLDRVISANFLIVQKPISKSHLWQIDPAVSAMKNHDIT